MRFYSFWYQMTPNPEYFEIFLQNFENMRPRASFIFLLIRDFWSETYFLKTLPYMLDRLSWLSWLLVFWCVQVFWDKQSLSAWYSSTDLNTVWAVGTWLLIAFEARCLWYSEIFYQCLIVSLRSGVLNPVPSIFFQVLPCR